MDDLYSSGSGFPLLLFLAFLLILTFLLSILFFNRSTHKRKKFTMFYIEGTIDTIDFGSKTIRFSILPSSEFLAKLDREIKKALFLEETKGQTAIMIIPDKNINGKEVVFFSIAEPKANCDILLLEAKNNRNVIRVSVHKTELREKLANEKDGKCDVNLLHSILFRVI